MATFTMLPTGVTGTNEWIASDGSGACAATDVDNDNGDTEFCAEDASSHEVTFTMDAPSVAEGAIDSITSVQIKFSAAYTQLSGTGTMIRSYMGGTDISNGSNNHVISSGNSYAEYSGAAENYAYQVFPNPSVDWTYQNLEDLEIKLDKILNTASRTQVKVSFLQAKVTYVAAATGYGNDVLGVATGAISKINGIATADISKVNGI